MKAKFHGSHFAYTDRKGNLVEARHGGTIEVDPEVPLIKELLEKKVLVLIEEKVLVLIEEKAKPKKRLRF